MSRISRMTGTVGLCILTGSNLLWGWPWSQNMADQPSKGPLEATYPIPGGAVSREGRVRVTDRADASENLLNPMETDSESIRRGGDLYAIYCTPCHGLSGAGDGPVTEILIPPPPLYPLVDSRSDGYLYGTVRFGGPVMPPYGAVMRDEEIWDLVNYLRGESDRQSGR